VPLAGPVREQPHFVLGPKSPCHEGGPCGAKRGAPFAATRERTRYLADTVRGPRGVPAGNGNFADRHRDGQVLVSTSAHHDADQLGTLAAGNDNLPHRLAFQVLHYQRVCKRQLAQSIVG
jgi:hypothetical protein